MQIYILYATIPIRIKSLSIFLHKMDWKRNFVNRISSIQSKIRNTIQTRFYYDMEDIDHFVILERTKRILLANDITRGYVDRRWVFDKFKHAIHPIQLRDSLQSPLRGYYNPTTRLLTVASSWILQYVLRNGLV